MEQFADLFEQHLKGIETSKKNSQLASKSFAKARDLGLPNRFKNEDWKYTNIKKAFPKDLRLTSEPAEEQPLDLDQDFIHLVFRNGRLVHQDEMPNGITVDASQVYRDEESLDFSDGVAAFAFALAEQTAVISVEKNIKVAKPLQVTFLADAEAAHSLFSSRVVVNCAAGSELEIFERQQSSDQDATSTCLVSWQVSLAAQARLKLAKLQELAVSSYVIDQSRFSLDRDAHLHIAYLGLGAKIARYDLKVVLSGVGAEACFDASNFTGTDQHLDYRSEVVHAVGNTRSSQLYKTVLTDEARCVFNGKVKISKGASLADAEQLHHSLVLSDGAEVDTKPQMEIDNDDVKCAHGASIGSLDPDQLFYLQSRGIPLEAAQTILSRGFLLEPLGRIALSSQKIAVALNEALLAKL